MPSYFGLFDFFFLRALAWAMFDSAKNRKVATPIGLAPLVSNLSAVAATFFCDASQSFARLLIETVRATDRLNDDAIRIYPVRRLSWLVI